jgi:Flp pilus assembly protein TadG
VRGNAFLRRLLREDRGAGTVELALATSALLLILLSIVQFALWSHATHVAQAAASQGLAAARVQDGTAADGDGAAQRMLDQLGDGPLINTNVAATRDATSASVRVTGEAASIVPLLRLPVHAEAFGSVERFVPMGGG